MSESTLDTLSDEDFLKQEVPVVSSEDETSTTVNDVSTPSDEDTASNTTPSDETSAEEVTPEAVFPDDFDYKGEYEKLCKPFKANGQLVTIRNADEIISLMQKGIGYTAKSQKLQEQVRIASMLENAQVDKEQLMLLIDASKKNPKALQKLIRESNIDPLDLDLSDDAEYSPPNYEVSDEEIQFKNTLEELNQNTYGKELLSEVKDWDAASKDTVWKQPTLLNVLAEQVESGVYKTITKEIARRKLVGTVANNTPFLQAYHEIGNQLLEHRNKAKETNTSVANSGKVVVDRRVIAPKSTLANSDKVAAASPNKSARQATSGVNPLLMSDEEFMKLSQPHI